jgi:hypothetical protein
VAFWVLPSVLVWKKHWDSVTMGHRLTFQMLWGKKAILLYLQLSCELNVFSNTNYENKAKSTQQNT